MKTHLGNMVRLSYKLFGLRILFHFESLHKTLLDVCLAISRHPQVCVGKLCRLFLHTYDIMSES